MSDDITEDHWKRRYEELECQMNEKVGKLEGLLTNAINQIKILTLERDSAKETAAAANARSINAKAGKKKAKQKAKNLQASTNEPAENVPSI